MYPIAVLLLTFIYASATNDQQNGQVDEGPWRSYGYIALGAVILVVAIVVLVRRQHRKFNE